jgi:hypothetical protein
MSGREVATLDAVGSEAGREDQWVDERMGGMRLMMRLLLLMEMKQTELVLD